MGDISEIRILVVVFTFLGLSVFLMGLIPSEFFAYSYEGRTTEVPDYFDAIDLLSYADTVNVTLDDSGGYMEYEGYYYYDFDLGGHNFRLEDSDLTPYLELKHFWYWWFIKTNWHSLEWRNGQGISRGFGLDDTELDADYTEGAIKYSVKCDHLRMMGFVGFNETKWAKPSEAWENNELMLLFAIEFDQVNTSINAWNIVSMLLFFQLPEVNWFIGFILGICLWIPIAYVSYILLLRAIGAIFGGGGA